MISYFHKDVYFGTWQDQDSDPTFCHRTIKALGHKESDVKMIKFPIQLRNDQSFIFSENKELCLLETEESEVEIDGELTVQTKSVVAAIIEGEQIFPKV